MVDISFIIASLSTDWRVLAVAVGGEAGDLSGPEIDAVSSATLLCEVGSVT